MPPTLANGKICYLEIPSSDIAGSAEFYKRVFGWNIRQRGDGHTAFDDTTGEAAHGCWGARPQQNRVCSSTLWSTMRPGSLA